MPENNEIPSTKVDEPYLSQRQIFTVLMAFYLLWIFRVFAIIPLIDNQISSSDLKQIVGDTWRVLFWLVPPILMTLWKKPKNGFSAFRFGFGISRINTVKYLIIGTVILLLIKVPLLYFEKQSFNLVAPTDISMMTFWVFRLGMVPLVEETLFRGFFQSYFEKFFTPRRAIVLQALFFTLAHFYWLFTIGLSESLINFLNAFILGLWFGYLSYKTKSTFPGMLAHYIHNALVFLWV